MEFLVKQGANIEKPARFNMTPFFIGQYLYLVDFCFVYDFYSIFYIACQNGHIGVAKFLLLEGADKEAQESSIGATPLYIGKH